MVIKVTWENAACLNKESLNIFLCFFLDELIKKRIGLRISEGNIVSAPSRKKTKVFSFVQFIRLDFKKNWIDLVINGELGAIVEIQSEAAVKIPPPIILSILNI